jgi:hypothetical protein
MKFISVFVLIVGLSALAAGAETSDSKAIQGCLEHWGKHPFGKDPKFRVISGKVKVLGIGGDVTDETTTKEPELVLVKPNVAVLSKSTLALMNPKGWYCIKGKVAVLGKSVVELQCDANLASSNDGATVMGGGNAQNGVTVLGTSHLERKGCVEKK